jgi:sulfate transport system permease protein
MRRSPWLVAVMFTYLGFLLLLPLGALVGTGLQYPWQEVWSLITAPMALAAYQLTLGTALTAAVLNTIFGLYPGVGAGALSVSGAAAVG